MNSGSQINGVNIKYASDSVLVQAWGKRPGHYQGVMSGAETSGEGGNVRLPYSLM